MYDVAIIGAGICGCFIAHDLSKYQLSVALIDKAEDVANGATMANSAMIHSGHDPKPGTLKARFNVRGNQMYEEICRELQVDFKRTSAFVVATDEQEEARLEILRAQALERGVPAVMRSRKEAIALEPNLSDGVSKALELPTTGIITPWEVCMALAEEAVLNGTSLLLRHKVCSIEQRESAADENMNMTGNVTDVSGRFFRLHMETQEPVGIHAFPTTNNVEHSEETLDARIVINAAGVYADEIYRMISDNPGFTITPKRGEYFVLDHEQQPVVSRIIYPTPSEKGKGVLVIPTIHNNILLGPSADEIEDKEDVGTTAERLSYIRNAVSKTVKNIPMQKVIRNFAGLRASGSTRDFIIEAAKENANFINVAAIESPGLSAAPAISEYVTGELLADKLIWVKKEHFIRRKPQLHLYRMSQEERNKLVLADPAYGHMVCRCEQITEGEIRDAIRRPAGATTVKGVKMRTRPGMGRCQGGFCEPLVRDILEEELGHGQTGKEAELVIIGGGSAGMAAAISAYEQGLRDILILEQDAELGGILQQCIHNGFGLHTFGEELSGPAYAQRYYDKIRELGIAYRTNTMVLHLHEDKSLEYVNPQEGYVTLQAKCVILAMGCRERNRGAISIPGTRPLGVWTAGTAQRYLNLEGYLVGKKVFILGSGDIGLIMARRMTLEGAKVLGVAELMPYSNGLQRNIKQCLEDFDIPLFLSHTVTCIRGQERVTGIQITQVDDHQQPIPGTEKEFDVDTLLLSVGLLPENYLSEESGIRLHPRTKGPVVDEALQTNIPGVFACGNVLHVHDLVDFVSAEGKKAGQAAARYLCGTLAGEAREVSLMPEDGSISYVLPAMVHPERMEQEIEVCFRVTQNYKDAVIRIKIDGKPYKDIKKKVLLPAEMEKIKLKNDVFSEAEQSLTFQILSQAKAAETEVGA